MSAIAQWWGELTAIELAWLVVGFGGQGMFTLRFLVQWISTERARRSVVPEAFWYFSLIGAAAMMAYGIHRADPVIMVGQLTGFIIYFRNLYFIWREKGRFVWRPAPRAGVVAAPVESTADDNGAPPAGRR